MVSEKILGLLEKLLKRGQVAMKPDQYYDRFSKLFPAVITAISELLQEAVRGPTSEGTLLIKAKVVPQLQDLVKLYDEVRSDGFEVFIKADKGRLDEDNILVTLTAAFAQWDDAGMRKVSEGHTLADVLYFLGHLDDLERNAWLLPNA
jgi:hypothetical protein